MCFLISKTTKDRETASLVPVQRVGFGGPVGVNERYWHGVISGERSCLGARLLRPVLRVASWPYALAAGCRRRLYRMGWKRSFAAGVPVISVGNLTVGGTGKTPLAAWVVGELAEAGRTPAILTRGYKAVGGASDEAEMLKRATGAPVIVNADRVAGAAVAVDGGADVLVMDDGFQHLRLRRNLDIVTIDATCPFGYGAVLPRGTLREPAGALRFADVVVVTRCDQVTPEALAAIRERVASLAGRAAVAESVMQPTRVCAFDGSEAPVESLSGRLAWAFCGLANPEGFYRTLTDANLRLVGRTSFNDHHAYTGQDVSDLLQRASSAGATLLLTTAKDAVKLAALGSPPPELRWLEIAVEFSAGGEELRRAIASAAGAAD